MDSSSAQRTDSVVTPLRHAIVGIGAGIVGAHLPALQQLETVTVVGGSDVNPDSGESGADKLSCPFYTDHRQLLAETHPDVTVILTPPPVPRLNRHRRAQRRQPRAGGKANGRRSGRSGRHDRSRGKEQPCARDQFPTALSP